MMNVQERIERDIGKLVVRMNTLAAQLEEALEENERLRAQAVKQTTEAHAHGS